MEIFSLPDGKIDSKDRGQWITIPFDRQLAYPLSYQKPPPEPPPQPCPRRIVNYGNIRQVQIIATMNELLDCLGVDPSQVIQLVYNGIIFRQPRSLPQIFQVGDILKVYGRTSEPSFMLSE